MTSIKAGLNAIICLPKDMAINMLRLNQIEPTSSPENSAYNWAKFQKISSVETWLAFSFFRDCPPQDNFNLYVKAVFKIKFIGDQ